MVEGGFRLEARGGKRGAQHEGSPTRDPGSRRATGKTTPVVSRHSPTEEDGRSVASHVPGSSKKKKKKRSLNSKNDRRSLSPGKQSDGSKRYLSSDRFKEFGDDIGRKATESRRRSLSPKKEPGYSSSPRVSRSVQRLHSSFVQGPQLDMRPLPCDEMGSSRRQVCKLMKIHRQANSSPMTSVFR